MCQYLANLVPTFGAEGGRGGGGYKAYVLIRENPYFGINYELTHRKMTH